MPCCEGIFEGEMIGILLLSLVLCSLKFEFLSSFLLQDYGEESEGLHIVQEYVKAN